MAKSNPVDDALWVAKRARSGMPLAAAFKGQMCRLYDGEESVHFDLKQETHREALKGVCTGSYPVSLVVASLPLAAHLLADATSIPSYATADWIIGDMEALDTVLGTDYRLLSPEDMLSTWKATRGMQLPRYYVKIAEPLQRLKMKDLKEGEAWSVSYSNLLAKVIAKYTMEPILLRPNDLDDPVENFRAALNESAAEEGTEVSHEDAYAWLVYAAIGAPPVLVGATEPPAVNSIIRDMDRLLDRLLPIVKVRSSETVERARLSKEAKTLYGRVLPVDQMTPPENILAHTLIGTVLDIINVAVVTFTNGGASVRVPTITGTEERIKIEGTCRKKEKYEWLKTLTQLAPVGGPLAPVRLNPVVISE